MAPLTSARGLNSSTGNRLPSKKSSIRDWMGPVQLLSTRGHVRSMYILIYVCATGLHPGATPVFPRPCADGVHTPEGVPASLEATPSGCHGLASDVELRCLRRSPAADPARRRIDERRPRARVLVGWTMAPCSVASSQWWHNGPAAHPVVRPVMFQGGRTGSPNVGKPTTAHVGTDRREDTMY